MKSFGNIAKDGQVRAVASGALTDGTAVIVNADGTVSVVAGADTGAGSNAQITSATTTFIEAAYDTNSDKVVVAYQSSSSYGRARVGTISGSSVSFGTEVVFQSSQTSVHGMVFDSNANKIVILYEDGSDGDSLQAIIGTVSGTDISFGTRVEIASNGGDGKLTFDSNANKVLASYKSGNTTYAVVGTVSGTSISFGSIATLISAQAPIKAQVFDSNANKHLIAYSDGDSSNFGSKVATISGTSVSFGSEVSIGQNPSGNNGAGIFDPDNNKVVVFYPDRANSTYGTARVGTISGTSISYGTAVVFNSDTTNWVGATYDTATNKIVVVYQADNSNRTSKVRTAEVSGTSITFNSDTITLESGTGGGGQRYFASVYDPDQDKTFIAYRDGSRSEHAYAKIYTVGSTNITSENFIGFSDGAYATTQSAAINTANTIDRNQSGLTAGQTYFVQTDGTLGLTAASPSVTAGTAISATELIVKG